MAPPIAELEERIKALCARFLDHQIAQEADAAFSPDLDAIAAFRLLVHAEIEDWIERCAMDEISDLEKRVQQGVHIRSSTRLILLSTVFGVELPLSLPFDEPKLRVQLSETLNAARAFIKENNGIKAGSFSKIASICGACIDEIDASLVQALNSYGTARGQVAHKSALRTTSLLAPSAEKNEALSLVLQLKAFFAGLQPI